MTKIMYRSALTGDLFTVEEKDGKLSISNKEICRAVENPRFRLVFQPVCDTAHTAVACTITDTVTGMTITRIGEVADNQPYPVTRAYQLAQYNAAQKILALRKEEETAAQEAYSSASEVPEHPQNRTETPARQNTGSQLIPDDEVLLFGSLHGYAYGKVKDSHQFLHFLGQIQENPQLTFQDKERNDQLKKLQQLAAEANL